MKRYIHSLRSATVAAFAVLAGAALAAACGDDDGSASPASPDSGITNDANVDGPGDGAPMRAKFGLDSRPANPTCRAPARPPSTSPVKFVPAFDTVTLGDVTGMQQPPGDKTRWFVAQRDGFIVSFKLADVPGDAGPKLTPPVVADLGAIAGIGVRNLVEAGLLGMAFHPKFQQNGRLYVSWVDLNDQSTIGYLTSTDGGASFTSYTKLLAFQREQYNHCGGGLAFGPDGFLYASFGDGGAADDYYENGQRLDGFDSKIIRIDVDTPPPVGQKYVIPDTNPFKNGGGEPSTFARGFRNPFRFSFDRATGELWTADVGQYEWEEIDKVVLGGNYGWSCREGAHPFNTDLAHCPNPAGLIEPVFELKHPTPSSRAIIGGYVYRGQAIPGLVGTYVFADYSAAALYTLAFDPVTAAPKLDIVNSAGPEDYFQGFAEDQDGELYVYGPNATYKLVAAGIAPPSTFPDRLSKTGCVAPGDVNKPAPGLVPYTVRSPLWSDGSDKERFIALPDGKQVTVKDDGDFDFPNGTVLMKTFALGGKKIETRLFMRHDDGGWSGYSYEWNDAQTDATLLPAGKTKTVGAQSWSFPSRVECLRCHGEAAGRSLGLELAQLNGDFTYLSTGRIANQLATLEHIGIFDKALPSPLAAGYPEPLGAGPVEGRARAYLHANCAQCHRPGGLGGGTMDLRFGTPLKDAKICNAPPNTGDLGIAGAKLLVPGDPAKSLLSVRPHSPLRNRMPPIASTVVDAKGVALIDAWIKSVTTCP